VGLAQVHGVGIKGGEAVTDRGLLELAAKAAGYGEVWTLDSDPDTFYIGPRYTGGAPKYRVWNPRDDDGDALRLAVKLGLTIQHLTANEEVVVSSYSGSSEAYEFYLSDPCAATRRAIVRAAAEIGRNMT
jgi:hypothetical protein